MHTALKKALDEGALIITANSRLCRYFQSMATAELTSVKHQSFIYSLSNLTPILFEAAAWQFDGEAIGYTTSDAVLNPIATKEEQLALWQQVVKQHANTLPANAFLNEGALAVSLSQTAELIDQYGVDAALLSASSLNTFSANGLSETEAWFIQVYQAFRAALSKAALMTANDFVRLIAPFSAKALLETYFGRKISYVVLAGFIQPTPREKSLFDWLANDYSVCQLQYQAPQHQENARTLEAHIYSSDEAAWQSVAAEVCEKIWSDLAAGKGEKSKDILMPKAPRYGLVIPEITTNPVVVKSVLEDVFAGFLTKALAHFSSDYHDAEINQAFRYSVSISRNLLDYPLPSVLLDVLALLKPMWSRAALQDLFAAPIYQACVGKSLSSKNLQAIQAWLKESCPVVIKRRDALEAFKAVDATFAKLLSDHIYRALDRLFLRNGTRDYEQIRSIDSWLRVLEPVTCELLLSDKASWSGLFSETPLADCVPHASMLQSLQSALLTLAKTAQVSAKMRWGTLVQKIRMQFSQTLYQPPVDNPAVQVMGVIESLGHHWQCLWVTGMQENAVPANVQYNPWLPKSLQRDYALPRTSLERESQYAKRVMDAHIDSSSMLIYSAAHLVAGRDALPSTLCFDYLKSRGADIVARDDIASQKTTSAMQRARSETAFQTIEKNEYDSGKTPKKSVARLLGLYGECPYRAFATHHLVLHESWPLGAGVSALLKGNLLHEALQLFWADCPDSKALQALTECELDQKISTILAASFKENTDLKCYAEPLQNALLDDLKRRILSLLEFEQTRPPFVVIGHEVPVTLNIGEAIFSMRADRLDLLQDGRVVIIDYKSGMNRVKTWFDERISSPQLPLYAIAAMRGEFDATIQTKLPDIDDFSLGGFVWFGFDKGAVSVTGIVDDEITLGKATKLSKARDLDRYQLSKQTVILPDLVDAFDSTLTENITHITEGDETLAPISALTCDRCGYQRLCGRAYL